jgi:hypothetical protein
LPERARGPRVPAMDSGSPLPATMSVRRGRDAYLAENGFTVAAYEDRWTKASFFGIPMWVPNTKAHRRAIMMHDLHHVATGYGTDLTGEAEISAWELRRGLSGLDLYVGSIVTMGAVMGLFKAPRRTLRAFRHSKGKTSSLFRRDRSYDALLDMTVGELRAELELPQEGLAEEPRRLHDFAPAPDTVAAVTG